MKFLIVDDSSTMRRIITNALTKIGQTDIVEAGNGKEAMEKMGVGGIDFILTDWNMPEMSGLEFVKAVRAKADWVKIPILMVTTNAVQDEVVEAVKAGVTDYLVKPFQPDTLKTKIESVLAK